MSDDDEWTPEKERSSNPDEVMKKAMSFLEKTMAEKEKEDRARKEAIGSISREIVAFKPPLLSKVLERYEAIWREVCLKFDEPTIRIEIMKCLLHAPLRLSETDEISFL